MSSSFSILHLPVLLAIASCGSPEESGPGPSPTATGTNTSPTTSSVAPTTGPAPVTSSPATSAPVTSAPATSAPVTSAPATSAPEPTPAGVSYAGEVEAIFVRTCVTGCHVASGFGGPGGSAPNSALDLSQGVGFTELTTKMSLQETSLPLVGDTLEGSYLWIKLNNLQTNGTIRMPFGVAMAEGDLAKVRAWIEGGAQP